MADVILATVDDDDKDILGGMQGERDIRGKGMGSDVSPIRLASGFIVLCFPPPVSFPDHDGKKGRSARRPNSSGKSSPYL